MNPMNPHPRLYVNVGQIRRLAEPTVIPLLRAAGQTVAHCAGEYARSAEFDHPRDTHNAHLIRARIAQKRVVTLLVRYFQTRQRRFRDAAVRHIEAIGNWEYWSWIMWRQNNPSPDAIFDLSYGENSATLAIAYDWLHDELTAGERAMFLKIARHRALQPFLLHTQPGGKTGHWFKRPNSNWNSVCTGGAGMLALAMREDLMEARPVLSRVEASMTVFMDSLKNSDGAWPEGLGYWNYGMRYAFMYLLSHENATGRKHPLLRRPSTRATLRFPLDFCPNGVPCSFGDVNHWKPLPIHHAVAERLGAKDVLAALDAQTPPRLKRDETWPDHAEMLLLHPRQVHKTPPVTRQIVKIYRGQDWGILADRLPNPRFYLAVRGGTTEVPHGHRDLLSFHAVVGSEALITNLGVSEYLDTTFSSRRYELFETTPPSKNTVLINGVGIAAPCAVTTSRVNLPGAQGIRLDATGAAGTMRDGPVAAFWGRLFLLLDGPLALILDHVEPPHPARIESRLHTFAKAAVGDARADLTGQRERMSLAYAASVPARLERAVDALTTPGAAPTLLRWCTRGLNKSVTMATLLCPGKASPLLNLEMRKGKIGVTIRIGTKKHRIDLNDRLLPVRSR